MHDMSLIGHPVTKNVIYGGDKAHSGSKRTFEVILTSAEKMKLKHNT